MALIGLAVAASFGVVGLLGVAPLTVGLTGARCCFRVFPLLRKYMDLHKQPS